MDQVILKRENCGDTHGFMVSAMFVPIRSPLKKPYISGFNSSKKRYKNAILTTHAEVQALNNLRYQCAKFRIRSVKADLHIFRKNRNGNMTSSAPCHHCTLQLAASKVVSIRFLYYFTESGELEKIKFKDWQQKEMNSFPYISRSKRFCESPKYSQNCSTLRAKNQ